MEHLLIKPLKIYSKDSYEILDVSELHKFTDIKYPDYVTVKFKYNKSTYWAYRDEMLSSIHGNIADKTTGTLALPGMYIHIYATGEVKQVTRIITNIAGEDDLLLDDLSTIPQRSLEYVVIYRKQLCLEDGKNVAVNKGLWAYPSVRIVSTNELSKFTEHLDAFSTLAFDTETSGLLDTIYNLDDPRDFLVSISISTNANNGYFIENDKSVEFEELLKYLCTKHLVVHNAAFDIALLNIIYGLTPTNFDDTIIIAKLLDENKLSYSLKTLAKEVLGKDEQLKLGDFDHLRYVNNNQLERINYILAYYACSDSANTYGLYGSYIDQLISDTTLYKYYREIEMASILPVSTEINKNGITIDVPKLQALKVKAEEYVAECMASMTAATDKYIAQMNIEYVKYQARTISNYADDVIKDFKTRNVITTKVDVDITRQLISLVNYNELPTYKSIKTLSVFHNRLSSKTKGISQYTLQLNNKLFMEELIYMNDDGFNLPLQKTLSGKASLNKAAQAEIEKYIHAQVSSGNTEQRLIDAREFFRHFKEYTVTMKLLNAFIIPTLALMSTSKDGKVHPSYNLLGTVSGRASCNNPNF